MRTELEVDLAHPARPIRGDRAQRARRGRSACSASSTTCSPWRAPTPRRPARSTRRRSTSTTCPSTRPARRADRVASTSTAVAEIATGRGRTGDADQLGAARGQPPRERRPPRPTRVVRIDLAGRDGFAVWSCRRRPGDPGGRPRAGLRAVHPPRRGAHGDAGGAGLGLAIARDIVDAMAAPSPPSTRTASTAGSDDRHRAAGV